VLRFRNVFETGHDLDFAFLYRVRVAGAVFVHVGVVVRLEVDEVSVVLPVALEILSSSRRHRENGVRLIAVVERLSVAIKGGEKLLDKGDERSFQSLRTRQRRIESLWKGGDVGRGFGSVKVKCDAKLFPVERLEVFEDFARLPALFDAVFAVHRLRK